MLFGIKDYQVSLIKDDAGGRGKEVHCYIGHPKSNEIIPE